MHIFSKQKKKNRDFLIIRLVPTNKDLRDYQDFVNKQ